MQSNKATAYTDWQTKFNQSHWKSTCR